MQITPLVAQAMHACHQSPDGKLRRTRNGYVATGAQMPVFTKRLVQMMDRAYLVRIEGELAETVVLTTKGKRVAQGLAAAVGTTVAA